MTKKYGIGLDNADSEVYEAACLTNNKDAMQWELGRENDATR
jgi:hypothetical protein